LIATADDGSQPKAETVERLAAMRDTLMAHETYPIFLVCDVPWYPDLDDELKVRSDNQGPFALASRPPRPKPTQVLESEPF
jgi:hypothetical protein